MASVVTNGTEYRHLGYLTSIYHYMPAAALSRIEKNISTEASTLQ